jgi:hypothetical protein
MMLQEYSNTSKTLRGYNRTGKKVLSVQLSKQEAERVYAIAILKGKTVSEILREALKSLEDK